METLEDLIVAVLFAVGAAHATSVVPLDLDRMIAGSQHIVHVRALTNAYEADPNVRVAFGGRQS